MRNFDRKTNKTKNANQSECENPVQTDVMEDMGVLGEADLFYDAQPKLEAHEQTTETEMLLERHLAN